MKHPHQQLALERECSEVLQQWEDWSETPMLVLSFAWLGLDLLQKSGFRRSRSVGSAETRLRQRLG
ncbi:hypothetical protein [Chamaesiphon sp.]|uniref:hypothetical protein n=1 Tax=Chamaesiphon sp. TaxID=2814140 RepID=UPI0035932A7C